MKGLGIVDEDKNLSVAHEECLCPLTNESVEQRGNNSVATIMMHTSEVERDWLRQVK